MSAVGRFFATTWFFFNHSVRLMRAMWQRTPGRQAGSRPRPRPPSVTIANRCRLTATICWTQIISLLHDITIPKFPKYCRVCTYWKLQWLQCYWITFVSFTIAFTDCIFCNGNSLSDNYRFYNCGKTLKYSHWLDHEFCFQLSFTINQISIIASHWTESL